MITVCNFSHPLSAEARDTISREWGTQDPDAFIDIRVQIDRNAPILPQVNAIVADATTRAGGNIYNIDCIVLPGLSDVAFLLAEHFEHANVIRMNAVPNSIPPKFMPCELIRSRRGRNPRISSSADEEMTW